MHEAVHAGRILMRSPGVEVHEDIVADVLAVAADVSKPSSSGNPAGEVRYKDAPA